MKTQLARLALTVVAACGVVSCTPAKATGVRSTPVTPSHSTVAARTTVGNPVENAELKAEPAERRPVALLDGRVRGVVPDSWVPFDRSREAVSFQIKNPADEGTPDAANVILLVPPRWPTWWWSATLPIRSSKQRPRNGTTQCCATTRPY